VNIGKWWIALPAVLLLTGFCLARADIASAMPTSQNLDYAYNPGAGTLTLNTQAAAVPDIMVDTLKVDGSIWGPACVPSVVGTSASCTFGGIFAPQTISFGATITDGAVLTGKTKVHCQKVATDGCSGTKSLNLH